MREHHRLGKLYTGLFKFSKRKKRLIMADLPYSYIASEEMDSSSVLADFELYNRAGIFDGAPSNVSIAYCSE